MLFAPHSTTVHNAKAAISRSLSCRDRGSRVETRRRGGFIDGQVCTVDEEPDAIVSGLAGDRQVGRYVCTARYRAQPLPCHAMPSHRIDIWPAAALRMGLLLLIAAAGVFPRQSSQLFSQAGQSVLGAGHLGPSPLPSAPLTCRHHRHRAGREKGSAARC